MAFKDIVEKWQWDFESTISTVLCVFMNILFPEEPVTPEGVVTENNLEQNLTDMFLENNKNLSLNIH